MKSTVFCGVLAVLFLAGCGSGKEAETRVPPGWPEVNRYHKPWTRWWWMGNAVDRENLDTLLAQYAEAGFGGVEITPIYGAKGYEEDFLDFLSPGWMHILQHTTGKAGELDMGVDMNLGTGWPFGGPQITARYAAGKMVLQRYRFRQGESLATPIKVDDPRQAGADVKLAALTAYSDRGDRIVLTEKVDTAGRLRWSPEQGNWELYAVFGGKTGQKVKRAAPGGAGYVMDHFSEDALHAYIERFDKAFGKKSPAVRAYFNDSYEVYGADFTERFFEEFRKRRGYDGREYLKELLDRSRPENDSIARIKADYRETLSDLLLEEFALPWADWAHRRGKQVKYQAHGSPGNLLDLYAAADIPECETFGSSYFPVPGLRRDSADIRNVDPDPVMLKFASSAAHVTGNNLVSSETFTWLTEHFKTSLSQCKPEVEQAFLSGVNHVFYHGTTYSPAKAGWPGWMFYASVNFAPNNTFWPHLKGMNDYITRCQSVLQSGKPDNELLIYWPVYDTWQLEGPLNRMIGVHDVDEWLHPTAFYKAVRELSDSGYSMDFISDRLLDSTAVNSYQALVFPSCELMPLKTLEKALSLAAAGATVIFEALPEDVPGLDRLGERRQAFRELLQKMDFKTVSDSLREYETGKGRILLAPDLLRGLRQTGFAPESLGEYGLKFIRRKLTDGKYYYLINHTGQTVDGQIPLRGEARTVEILDPQNGDHGKAAIQHKDGVTWVKVNMLPGEALILRTYSRDLDTDDWPYYRASEPVELSGGRGPGVPGQLDVKWRLRFKEGGPVLPGDRHLDSLQLWTSLPGDELKDFSGTAVYTTEFELDGDGQLITGSAASDTGNPTANGTVDPATGGADDYLLQLGRVAESARVWVNGKDAGILWSIPFQTRIGIYLKEGKNTLRIEVANLMANRIRYMDRRAAAGETGMEWRNYHEINFVNINYEPFDASAWPVMPSGLQGPVRIVPLNKE